MAEHCLLFRRLSSRDDWIRLIEHRDLEGWYLDPDCTAPAPPELVDQAGEDIYTDYGWNTEPRTYPVLAHIDALQDESPVREGWRREDAARD